MKNYQIKKTIESLKEAQKFASNIQSTYRIITIRKELEKLDANIEETVKPSDKYKEYDDKKMEIVRNSIDRNEDGTPIFVDKEKTAIKLKDDKKEEFSKLIQELDDEYKDVIEERAKKFPELDEFLNQDSQVDTNKFKLSDFKHDLPQNIVEDLFDWFIPE